MVIQNGKVNKLFPFRKTLAIQKLFKRLGKDGKKDCEKSTMQGT